MERPTNQHLFEAAKAGNEQALEELLERQRPLILSVARRYIDRREDREDFVQEVMKAAWTGFESAREGPAFTGWMIGIAENRGKNWLNRDRPKQEAVVSLNDAEYQDGGSAQPIAPDTCPAERVVALETTRVLFDAVTQSCSGVEFNVMIRKWNGRDYARIAGELSIKEATARSHYRRGERKLWTCLLTEHREFLGGEAVIAQATAKAEICSDLKSRLNAEEKQAFKAGERSRKAFTSACMKVRLFLPLSVGLLLFLRRVFHG